MKIIKNLLALTVLCTGITALSMQAPSEAAMQNPQAIALLEAVHADNAQTAENLLRNSPELANSYPQGIALLREAASYGNPKIVDLLLAAGANITPWDSYHLTPLMMAALGGHAEIVQKLINRGADVNAVDDSGQSAFNYVEYGGGSTEEQKAAVRKLLNDARNKAAQ
jgi:uroporphyrinogen-III synthase